MRTDTSNMRRPSWFASVSLCLLLSLAGCMSVGGGKKPAAIPLTDITWQWIETVDQESGVRTTVAYPENYTIVFGTDGTFRGKADCNLIGGRYVNTEGFKITPGPSTMAYCGENSLDQKYLEGLGLARAGGLDGSGHLTLESARSGIRMLFRNGGVAP
ncbi:MAG: META domain-containing protein [Desulfobacteraceae bacterium]|nr:META domain-containing protein [Desulfobacteraceae bacterium]MBC2751509.1 META domain-containing protein [Desulfobacteraceae bacterium]